MSAIITAGGPGATGNMVASGTVNITVKGTFTGLARVEIAIDADSLGPSVVRVIERNDAVTVDSVPGQTVIATVVGGGTGTSLNVSAL